MKRKYYVSGMVTITVHTILEAESPEQALRLAQERTTGHVHDSGNAEDMWVTSGELDGDVEPTEVLPAPLTP